MSQIRPLEILIAEDEPALRNLLSRFLIKEGNNVDLAQDGQEAINHYDSRLENKPYDLVITDLNMPKKNGAQVVKHVKNTRPETFVAVVTGNEVNTEYLDMLRELETLSPDWAIQKPYNLAEIFNKVEFVRSQLFSGYEPKYRSIPPTQS